MHTHYYSSPVCFLYCPLCNHPLLYACSESSVACFPVTCVWHGLFLPVCQPVTALSWCASGHHRVNLGLPERSSACGAVLGGAEGHTGPPEQEGKSVSIVSLEYAVCRQMTRSSHTAGAANILHYGCGSNLCIHMYHLSRAMVYCYFVMALYVLICKCTPRGR